MHFPVVCADGVAKVVDEDAQAFHLLRVRVIVSPVYERNFLPEIVLCDGLVRHQHEVLDDLGCRIPLIRLDIHRLSLFIQNDLGLREIEIDGAALAPFLTQDIRQLFH